MNKFINKLLFGKENKLFENIILCLAITLTCAFYYYDRYNSFMSAGRIIVAVLIFLVWVIGAYSSGKSKQWGFLIFTCAYWLIPHLYMIYYGMRDNLRDYNKYLSLLNKISDILVNKPFEFISEKTSTPAYLYVIILVIIVGSVYFIGVNLKTLLQNRKKESAKELD